MQSAARRTALALTAIALGCIGALTGDSAAMAGSDESIVTARGSVAWYHDGDQLVACDAKADGYSIEANYRLAGGTGTGRVLHAGGGAGTCEDRTWDKEEKTDIEIRMCYRDDFVITKCSDWQRAQALILHPRLQTPTTNRLDRREGPCELADTC